MTRTHSNIFSSRMAMAAALPLITSFGAPRPQQQQQLELQTPLRSPIGTSLRFSSAITSSVGGNSSHKRAQARFQAVDQIVFRPFNLLAARNLKIFSSILCNSRPSASILHLRSNPGARCDLHVRQSLGHDNDGASVAGRIDLPEDELWIKNVSSGVIHNEGDVVADKYTIRGVLGQGGFGITYEAERSSGDNVALKALSLRSMRGWKDMDLFEREARVLKSLKHPGIAEYIDYFQVDTKLDRVFYIAQKLARGKSLEDLVKSGWRVSEEEVKRIAIEVLSVLQYLGDLRPPVIHRDIKPKNIILDQDTGSVKVVDFGAVQDAASATLIGSTVVGTYGYMAPEQFQNRSTLQTDLYGLGGTMLYMLSGRSPSHYPQTRLKVDFQNFVVMSPDLIGIIDRLLEPAPEDRFQSAMQTINALRGISDVHASELSGVLKDPVWQPRIVQRPAGTQVNLRKTSTKLAIVIPPAGLTEETAYIGTFSVAWNAFVVTWTSLAIRGGGPVFFTLFSLPFWFVGFGLVKNTLSNLAVGVHLEFEGPHYFIEWSVGSFWKHRVVGDVQDISFVGIKVTKDPGRLSKVGILRDGLKKHVFGSSLETVELFWLLQEIRSHLKLPPEPLVDLQNSSTSTLEGFEFEDNDY